MRYYDIPTFIEKDKKNGKGSKYYASRSYRQERRLVHTQPRR